METVKPHEPWNKGKLVGQKPPLKPKDIWAIRIHLQRDQRIRDLVLFDLAVDSKLRGCDLVNPPEAAEEEAKGTKGTPYRHSFYKQQFL